MSTSQPRSWTRLPAKSPPSEPPMTTARGFTLNGDSHHFSIVLPALPNRLSLVQERLHPLAEVLAHVALQHEVVALAVLDLGAQAQQRLLGRLQRERRMACDDTGDLLGALQQRFLIFS